MIWLLRPRNSVLSPAQWAARQILPQDRLLGSLFSTTTRSQLSADTGLGKTMLGLAFNFAMRLGVDFLHWRCRRQASVFILDGEMPLPLVKERLAVAASWFGANSEDVTDGFRSLPRRRTGYAAARYPRRRVLAWTS